MLVFALRRLESGEAITLIPDQESFTTQAAANFLGMSRPFLIGLLKEGAIPFHHVGKHRRIYFKDLLNYRKLRDAERKEGLNQLFKSIDEAGLYDADLPSKDEG